MIFSAVNNKDAPTSRKVSDTDVPEQKKEKVDSGDKVIDIKLEILF